jgi:hypothetical protein
MFYKRLIAGGGLGRCETAYPNSSTTNVAGFDVLWRGHIERLVPPLLMSFGKKWLN